VRQLKGQLRFRVSAVAVLTTVTVAAAINELRTVRLIILCFDMILSLLNSFMKIAENYIFCIFLRALHFRLECIESTCAVSYRRVVNRHYDCRGIIIRDSAHKIRCRQFYQVSRSSSLECAIINCSIRLKLSERLILFTVKPLLNRIIKMLSNSKFVSCSRRT
jgi:hypothetical protein